MPLQLGELADHVGEQVRLRAATAARRGGAASAPHRRRSASPRATRLHALHALELRAELVVIDDASPATRTRQRPASSCGLLEEELRVGKTRTHHALVAFDNVAGVSVSHVADDQEAVRELARWPGRAAEVLLVRLHREDQAFLRHLQELAARTAHRRTRPAIRPAPSPSSSRAATSGPGTERGARPHARAVACGIDLLAAAPRSSGHHAAFVHAACSRRSRRAGIGDLEPWLRKRWPCVARPAVEAQRARPARRRVAMQRDQAVRRAHELLQRQFAAVGELVAS